MQISPADRIGVELFGIIPSSDLAERYAIIRQLFARRCWSGDPKELLNAEGKLNMQASLPEVWNTLTRLEKIAALFQSRGFTATCSLLPTLQQGADEEKRLKDYQTEVESLTGGVITSPSIPHYLALRTFLFADATAFTEMFVKVNHRITLSALSDKGSRRATLEDLQEVLPKHLRTLFTLIDSACFSNKPEDVAKAQDSLMICSDLIGSCRQAFEKVRGELEFKSCFERMDRAWKCFQTLEKAFHDPLHLLPILLFPIAAQKEFSVEAKINNQDQSQLSDAAERWLNDCLIACRKNLEALFKEFEKQRLQSRREEAACEQSLESLQNWNEMIGKEVRALKDLSLDKGSALPELLERVKKCSASLEALEKNYFGPLHDEVKKLVGKDSFFERQIFHRPRRIHSLMAHSVLLSLKGRAEKILKAHQLMAAFFLPELQLRSALFSPMDLLDLQIREAIEQFHKETMQRIEGDKRRKAEACFSQVNAAFSQFVDWMRGEWRTHDHAARSRAFARAFDRVRVFSPLMKRLLAATQDAAGMTDAGPGMKRLATALDFFSELVLLDCWPQFLSSCLTTATPHMERQTMFRLFSCSLREFACDDLKRVWSTWEFPWLAGATELKKKLQSHSDKVKSLLKELQSGFATPPAFESFETSASVWFAKLTETINRIQVWEDNVVAALEAACDQIPELSAHYDGLCEKIKSGRQVWERCFTLNRGLISDLLLRQLIEEEGKSKAVDAEVPVEEEAYEEQPIEEPVKGIVAAASSSTPPAPSSTPPASRKLLSVPALFSEVAGRCRDLEQHLGFVLSSKESKLQFLHQFEGNAINALLHTTHCLKELIQADEKNPVCQAEIALRVAVLLEQASKLALSLKGIALSENEPSPLLAKTGREAWKWQEHNPLRYCQALEKAGALVLTDEQKVVMQNLDRVIEVSSRYPHSGIVVHQKTQKLLQTGLGCCLFVLDACCPNKSHGQENLNNPYELQDLAPHLRAEVIPDFSDEAERLLASLQRRIRTIKLYRLIPEFGKVEGDAAIKQRMGTIDSSLDNMSAVFNFAREVLLGKEEPFLCLTIASSAMRQKAVALELAALIHLAQGAHPSASDPTQHYLFASGEAPMKRYSHALDQFAQALKLPVEQQHLFSEMKAYLREGYRYGGDKTVTVFIKLSLLRDRLVNGQVTPKECNFLTNTFNTQDPDKQLDILDQCIIRTIRGSAKMPLLEALRVVEGMLASFEERIRKNV